MPIISILFVKIISLIDLLFKKIFNRNLSVLIFDNLQLKFSEIIINEKKFKIYSPSSILLWRSDTYFTKEPETLEWIKNFKKKELSKIVFWDIGANVGLYTLYGCAIHQNDIEVFSFEPSVNNLKGLATNMSINNLSNQVKIISNPLNNKNNFSHLNETSLIEGSALNSFSNKINFQGETFNPSLSYETLGFTLDYLVDKNYLKHPNYIKIDVDGNEHLILEGFKKNINNSKIFEILVEINENYKFQLQKILDFMSQNNFKLTEKFKTSILSNKEDNFSKTYNYLFKR